ncbi:hypothetical protein DID80_07285 [Candidatus Marinamargulisbacteria bacterium SCGC AAA071-K20]|nr:hypothetical protein DID80_07285 [Candidatus Marinamargulisbacteria bacterium SCGC AAA071-K20]
MEFIVKKSAERFLIMIEIEIDDTEVLGFDIKDKILRSYILFRKSSCSREFILNQLKRVYMNLSHNKSLFTTMVLNQFSDRTKSFEKFRIEFLLITGQYELAQKYLKNNPYLVGSEVIDYVNDIHRHVLGILGLH